MKILKVIAVLLSLLIVSLIIESCTDETKCDDCQYGEYSFISFYASPIDSGLINEYLYHEMENNPHTFRKDFGVHLYFHLQELTAMNKIKPVRSSFIQSAYAQIAGPSCTSSLCYAKDSIISIQVFSDKNFGETHLAGTDIAEFFKVRKWPCGYNPISETHFPPCLPFTSFDDYLKRPAPIFKEGNEFYFSLICLIVATDIEAGEYNFRFVVKLSDERIFEETIKGILE